MCERNRKWLKKGGKVGHGGENFSRMVQGLAFPFKQNRKIKGVFPQTQKEKERRKTQSDQDKWTHWRRAPG